MRGTQRSADKLYLKRTRKKNWLLTSLHWHRFILLRRRAGSMQARSLVDRLSPPSSKFASRGDSVKTTASTLRSQGLCYFYARNSQTRPRWPERWRETNRSKKTNSAFLRRASQFFRKLCYGAYVAIRKTREHLVFAFKEKRRLAQMRHDWAATPNKPRFQRSIILVKKKKKRWGGTVVASSLCSPTP